MLINTVFTLFNNIMAIFSRLHASGVYLKPDLVVPASFEPSVYWGPGINIKMGIFLLFWWPYFVGGGTVVRWLAGWTSI